VKDQALQPDTAARQRAIDAALSQMDKQFGKGTVLRLGSRNVLPVTVIRSGSISLDSALGVGGFPRGRVVEVFGPESSGKTTLALQVIAQAQKIEVAGDRVTVTFGPSQRALREMFEQNRTWLETIAQRVAGRNMVVAAVLIDAAAAPAEASQPPAADQKSGDRKSALREQALADAGVQAMLDVFPAEIRDVEEM